MRNYTVWYKYVDVHNGDGDVGNSIMDLIIVGESKLTPPYQSRPY
jgi:hypothetical protein